jgi:hypothetical protein
MLKFALSSNIESAPNSDLEINGGALYLYSVLGKDYRQPRSLVIRDIAKGYNIIQLIKDIQKIVGCNSFIDNLYAYLFISIYKYGDSFCTGR